MPPPGNRFAEELERRGVSLEQPRAAVASARNRFELELQRRVGAGETAAAAVTEEPAEERSGFGVFLDRLFEGTVNAALATPSAAAQALNAMRPMAGVEDAIWAAHGRRAPSTALVDMIPRPRTEHITAAGDAISAMLPGGRSPGQAYDETLTDVRMARAQDSADHPIATAAGEVGGSVASLLLAKRPLQGTIRRAENAIVRGATPFTSAADDAPGLARAVDRALSSQMVRLPIRGTFRAAETGLEAAYLEMVSASENDPILAASLAAGGQVASSAALQGLKGMVSGGASSAALKFSLAAMSTAGIWQMLKSATPGGRDRILESIETGYDKVTFGVALGVLGGIVGGRGRNSMLAEDMPQIVESLTTAPRGAVLHVLTRFVGADEDDQERFEEVLEEMQENPDFAGRNDFEREIVQQFRSALEPADGDTGRGPRRGVIDRSRSSSR